MAASLLLSAPPSAAAARAVIWDENIEDGCSICLEPFNSSDPPTVTKCKHEFHLQCILEWSQRSKECPMCWQLLVLKDPSSQELLAAVENERNLRSTHNVHHIHRNIDDDTVNSAHSVSRSRRQIAPSHGLPSVSTENASTSSSTVLPSLYPQAIPRTQSSTKHRSSEFLSFSASLRSKFSTASARYKESISKGTRDLKEKLIAHNDSVKELSKGVQREMTTGVAGISKMFGRLDFTSKRGKKFGPFSSYLAGTSNSPLEGEDDTKVDFINENDGVIKEQMRSVFSPVTPKHRPKMHRSFSCKE